MVERELDRSAPRFDGGGTRSAPPRCSATTATSTTLERELAAAHPRPASLDDRLDAVRAHVRATVREKLLVANPGYLPAVRLASARMRIATWNVNSLKARLPRVEEFLGYADVDVLCLQETKLADKTFPALHVLRRSATSRCTTARASGTASRSCRASASTNVTNGFGDAHVDPYEGDARVVAATAAASAS